MEYKVDLKGILLFEFKSWVGRKFLNSKPHLYPKENYLNLGCGNNVVDGYINADFFYKFHFLKNNNRKLEWQLDLRYPLNCKNDIFDGIYSEHTLEHLYPDDAKKLLAELFRVLKKGAYIRITVPDIQKYIHFYNKNYEGYNSSKFLEKFKTGCSAIRNITQNFLHFSAWDFEELKILMEEVGFKNVEQKELGKTSSSKLNLDIEARSWETLYIEATK